MLQTQTPTTCLTSVALSHGQGVPQGAQILGIYATVRASVYLYGCARVHVVGVSPSGLFVCYPVTRPNDYFCTERADLIEISALIKMECK